MKNKKRDIAKEMQLGYMKLLTAQNEKAEKEKKKNEKSKINTCGAEKSVIQ